MSAIFFSYIIITSQQSNEISDSKPFAFSPQTFVIVDDNICLLDGNYNKICVYDVAGNFKYYIKFPSYGMSVLFKNQSNELCRYDYRDKLIYVYDVDTGEIINKYESSSTEIVMSETKDEKINAKIKGGIIFPAFLEFTNNGETKNIMVESPVFFIIKYLIKILFATCLIIAVINIIKLILIKNNFVKK